MKLKGLGEFKVLTLRECPPGLEAFLADCPEKCAEYWRAHIGNDVRFNGDVESLYVLVMNTRRRVLGHFLVAQGTLDTILSHAREVFRGAIVANAAAIVLMHNHPSGDPGPSEGDITVTRNLTRAGNVLGVQVLDHVIMGQVNQSCPKGYTSLRELGYLCV